MSDIKWIKITTGMFEDEKIRLIEKMPDGDTILIIWVKLLTLAGRINAGGYILLTENIPYTDEMLATIFARNLSTVQLALLTFEKFGMVNLQGELLKISNWEKHQNIEGLDKIREQNRIRQAAHRSKVKLLPESNMTHNVTVTPDNGVELELEKEKEVEEEREKETTASTFEAYKEELKVRHPELNISEEWGRCQIWYRDHKKKMKSPSLALGNWCRKEVDILSKKANGSRPIDPDKYTRGYGSQVVGR